jgi:hemolysin D
MTTSSPPMPSSRAHPALELARRYGAVFRAAWAHRRELAGPERLTEEAAFLPAALSLQETPIHPAPRRTAFAIMGVFLCALLWSAFGEVDIVAVAQGRIVVSERTKLIQPLERSSVRRILVKDGDVVTEGQPLMELDPTNAVADRTNVEEQLRAQESEAMRAGEIIRALEPGGKSPLLVPPDGWSRREASAAQTQLAAEWAEIASKLAKLASEEARREAEVSTARALIAKLEITLPLAMEREKDVARLVSEGFMAGHAGQDRTRERLELERDLETLRSRMVEAQAALRESGAGRAAYLAETRRATREREAQAELKRQQLLQERAKATARERLTLLSAPASGTVQQVSVHTVGGVVTEAQTLMVIVPRDAEVTAEVSIENKDVGFVSEGLPAEIKLETFPFTHYGTVPAKVTRVSADAVADEKRGALFPATLALATKVIKVDGKEVRLTPGMNVTAEVRTGRRTVLEYLLAPVQQMRAEGLRER